MKSLVPNGFSNSVLFFKVPTIKIFPTLLKLTRRWVYKNLTSTFAQSLMLEKNWSTIPQLIGRQLFLNCAKYGAYVIIKSAVPKRFGSKIFKHLQKSDIDHAGHLLGYICACG